MTGLEIIPGISESEIHGKTVLVRADFNVPLAEDRSVADDARIETTLPTLSRLTSAGAKVVVLSHFGRPKGRVAPEYSLDSVAESLRALSDIPVHFCDSIALDVEEEAVDSLQPGEILILQNTRFHPGEESNSMELAERWASYSEVFVNDAFGAAHRAHASMDALPRLIRERGGRAVGGLLVRKELEVLSAIMADPVRPFVAVIGGAKISGKIDVIEALLPRVDRLLIGGAMANTFFLALGLEVGRSLVEEDRVEMARDLLERAGDKVILPVDCVVAEELSEDVASKCVGRSEVSPKEIIGDIGDQTAALFREELLAARTIFWNGPMGVFELEPFSAGTLAVALAAAEATDAGANSVLGGGDSGAAAEVAGVSERLTHISTGGGASLEFLAGDDLPGLNALEDATLMEIG